MFVVCASRDMNGYKEYGIFDTKDGVVEWYTPDMLMPFINHGIKIKGYFGNGVFGVVAKSGTVYKYIGDIKKWDKPVKYFFIDNERDDRRRNTYFSSKLEVVRYEFDMYEKLGYRTKSMVMTRVFSNMVYSTLYGMKDTPQYFDRAQTEFDLTAPLSCAVYNKSRNRVDYSLLHQKLKVGDVFFLFDSEEGFFKSIGAIRNSDAYGSERVGCYKYNGEEHAEFIEDCSASIISIFRDRYVMIRGTDYIFCVNQLINNWKLYPEGIDDPYMESETSDAGGKKALCYKDLVYVPDSELTKDELFFKTMFSKNSTLRGTMRVVRESCHVDIMLPLVVKNLSTKISIKVLTRRGETKNLTIEEVYKLQKSLQESEAAKQVNVYNGIRVDGDILTVEALDGIHTYDMKLVFKDYGNVCADTNTREMAMRLLTGKGEFTVWENGELHNCETGKTGVLTVPTGCTKVVKESLQLVGTNKIVIPKTIKSFSRSAFVTPNMYSSDYAITEDSMSKLTLDISANNMRIVADIAAALDIAYDGFNKKITLSFVTTTKTQAINAIVFLCTSKYSAYYRNKNSILSSPDVSVLSSEEIVGVFNHLIKAKWFLDGMNFANEMPKFLKGFYTTYYGFDEDHKDIEVKPYSCYKDLRFYGNTSWNKYYMNFVSMFEAFDMIRGYLNDKDRLSFDEMFTSIQHKFNELAWSLADRLYLK